MKKLIISAILLTLTGGATLASAQLKPLAFDEPLKAWLEAEIEHSPLVEGVLWAADPQPEQDDLVRDYEPPAYDD